MKTLIAIGLVTALTGCGTVQQAVKYNFTPSVDLAKEECAKMGFNLGTPNYQMCVLRQTDSIRNARAQAAAAHAQASNNVLPRSVQCRQVGSYIHCNEF
jgi:hypothetical protein